jgi:hypothetical protein
MKTRSYKRSSMFPRFYAVSLLANPRPRAAGWYVPR